MKGRNNHDQFIFLEQEIVYNCADMVMEYLAELEDIENPQVCRLKVAQAIAHEVFEVLFAARNCFNQQHNLLSTATDEQRRDVIANFSKWWNYDVVPIMLVVDEHSQSTAEPEQYELL